MLYNITIFTYYMLLRYIILRNLKFKFYVEVYVTNLNYKKTNLWSLIHLGGFFHKIFPCFEHSWINTSFFYHGGKTVAISTFFNFRRTFISISMIYGYICTPTKPMPSFNGSCLFMRGSTHAFLSTSN